MNLELWRWLVTAPFGDDMYLMCSLATVQQYEEHGFTISRGFAVDAESEVTLVDFKDSPRTIVGRRLEVSTSMRDNEVRLFNSFGLQAVFLLKPEAPDLRTPPANVIEWPSPQMNT